MFQNPDPENVYKNSMKIMKKMNIIHTYGGMKISIYFYKKNHMFMLTRSVREIFQF